MLRAVLNKSWRQHPTKQQLYSYLPPITKTIKDDPDMRDTAGEIRMYFCGTLHTEEHRQDDQLEPIYKQLCADTKCSLEDLLGVMNDRDGWLERVREIRADDDDPVDVAISVVQHSGNEMYKHLLFQKRRVKCEDISRRYPLHLSHWNQIDWSISITV